MSINIMGSLGTNCNSWTEQRGDLFFGLVHHNCEFTNGSLLCVGRPPQAVAMASDDV
jgi:hypothetical protein